LKKLPRNFYLQPTVQVAKELLGKFIIRRHRGKELIGKIVEVEAYRGSIDPASHAYRGKTKRNEVMFCEGGHLYVYFTYGMHFCANVVTKEAGIGEAVLIRAVEPIEGIDSMLRNRSKSRPAKLATHHLTNGPAKLCQAFGIGRGENGTDLLGTQIYVVDAPHVTASDIGRSTRIGIINGREKKWRFYVKGSRWISK
jgi:DNA-3-methyladenine glycosylase